MLIGNIAGATHRTPPPCALVARLEQTKSGPSLVSAWFATPKEAERLAAGAPLYLRLLGCHPATAMWVGDVPALTEHAEMPAATSEQGCLCQGCGMRYRVDVLVSDELWAKITPKPETPGAGLLCGRCVCDRLEALGAFAAYELGPQKQNGPEPGPAFMRFLWWLVTLAFRAAVPPAPRR